MGVDVVVQGASDEEHAAVKNLFARWDETFSRFRPDERAQPGQRQSVRHGARIRALRPRSARRSRCGCATSGLVDPTVGVAVEAAGYDRDFALLVPDTRPTTSTMPGGGAR